MKYFVESYGCTMNYGEGEQHARRMESLGHERAGTVDDADIVILNTCTVVDTTEKVARKTCSLVCAWGPSIAEQVMIAASA